MNSIALTLRRYLQIASVCALALSLAAVARAQLVTGPSQIGSPVLTGPNPADDPNFPGANGRVTIAGVGGDVTWTRHQLPVLDWVQAGDPNSGVNIPTVLLPKLENKPAVWADYLGFIDGEGALLEAGPRGAVYVFNGSARTLSRRYGSLEQIPETALAALKNRKYVYVSSRDVLSVATAAEAEAGSAAAPAAAKPYEADPNLAGAPLDDYPLIWDPSRTNFNVKLPQLAQRVPAVYLGFNERGSWIASALGKLYLWNLPGKTLVQASDSWWDAPLDLRNPSVLTQGMIYYRQHQYRTAAGPRQSPDPNLPPMTADLSKALRTSWQYQGSDLTRPLVFAEVGSADYYLGFDERGAWVQDHHFGIYAWSFRTWKLERVASRFDNIPHAAVMRLHNRPAGTGGG